ncbi:MAG: hypothetical protein HY894_06125 [Deltaproteobacteria bacterium]|nr:hypothetical protein [Deltaproteobacteria bacterium]
MRQIKRLFIITVIAFMGLVAAFANGAGAAQVQVMPSAASANPGDVIGVDIVVDNVANLGGYQFAFNYNQAVLDVRTITVNAGFDQTIKAVYDNATGAGQAAAFVLNNPPLSGAPLTIATVNFYVKAAGISDITLSGVILGMVGGTEIPSAVVNATVVGGVVARYTLTVVPSGAGTGVVTSSPVGIDCGTTCSAQFYDGVQVTLTAVADAGMQFIGWSVPSCAGTGPCVAAMTADAAVTANFDVPDAVPPTGTVVINNNGAYANSTTVTLAPAATDNRAVAEMRFSNDNAAWAAWQAYNASAAWQLAPGDGAKTVYAQFRDAALNVSLTASDTIALDATAPVDGTLSAVAANAVNSLAWDGFSDAGSGLNLFKLVYAEGAAPVSCASGTALYTGIGSSFVHKSVLNGVPYAYRVCALDNAGNVSIGATAVYVTPTAPNGLSVASDDTGTPGIMREDGGSDADNLDTATGKPRVDLAFNFGMIVKDPAGAQPQYARLYMTGRGAPQTTDYYAVNLNCAGSWAAGASCSYPTHLGPSQYHKYYFEVKLADGTVLRYPATGDQKGPSIQFLNGYNLLSVPRDISAARLDGVAAFGSTQTYKWLSSGTLDNANKGSYVLVDTNNPVVPGDGYYTRKAVGKLTVPELGAYADVLSADYAVTLRAGWNLIANPYAGNVTLRNAAVQKGAAAPVTWLDAAASGWVVNAIYYYRGTDWGNTYTFEAAGGNPEATLAPWLGYWLYLNKADDTYTLIMPRP